MQVASTDRIIAPVGGIGTLYIFNRLMTHTSIDEILIDLGNQVMPIPDCLF